MTILLPGYVKWDGKKFITDGYATITGVPGPAGSDGYAGPAGANGIDAALFLVTDIKTDDYSANLNELVLVDPTRVPITITLPSALTHNGSQVAVKNTTSGPNTITVQTVYNQTIDGIIMDDIPQPFILNTNYQSEIFISDGSNWQIIANNLYATSLSVENTVMSRDADGGSNVGSFTVNGLLSVQGIECNNQKIFDLLDPVDPQDAVTKAYVDASIANVIADGYGGGVVIDVDGYGGLGTLQGSSQANWYINDITGDTANDGTAAVSGGAGVGPITFADWSRRMLSIGGVAAGVSMVAHVASNITTMVEGTINVARVGSTLQIDGYSGITNIRNGTFTPVITNNAPTNVPWSATDSIGTSWTTSILGPHSTILETTGKRVRNTKAGAALNSTFWPMKDLGGASCRFSIPIIISLSQGLIATTPANITNADTYALEQLPNVTIPWGLSFYVDGYKGADGYGRQGIVGPFQEAVQLIRLAFSDYHIQMVLESNGFGSFAFYECDLGNNAVSSPMYTFVNCRTVNFLQTIGDPYIYAGLNIGNEEVYSGIIDGEHAIQTGELYAKGKAQISSVQVFDSSSDGISVEGCGGVRFKGNMTPLKIYGAGNAAYGISIASGSLGKYTSVANMTLLGIPDGGHYVNVDGTPVGYAGLPLIKSDISGGTGHTFAGLIDSNGAGYVAAAADDDGYFLLSNSYTTTTDSTTPVNFMVLPAVNTGLQAHIYVTFFGNVTVDGTGSNDVGKVTSSSFILHLKNPSGSLIQVYPLYPSNGATYGDDDSITGLETGGLFDFTSSGPIATIRLKGSSGHTIHWRGQVDRIVLSPLI